MVTDDARVWRMPDGDVGPVVQLSFALAESQAINRELVQQLGTAHSTIATLAVASHKRIHPDPLTVRELYEKFRLVYESHRSWVVMRNRLAAFLERFGDRMADSITPKDWAWFREKRILDAVKGPSKSHRSTMSKNTINQEMGWVKRLYNWAFDEEQNLVVCNPLARVKPMKCRKHRESWITEEDAQRMLAAPKPEGKEARTLTHAFFLLMLDTGLRFNEARRLRRDRIRARPDGRIVVDVGRTKNGKNHLVALTRRTFEALGEIDPMGDSPLIFAHMRRARGAADESVMIFAEKTMRRWFHSMCETAGVDARVADGDIKLIPHDIRHSAATLAHRRVASLKAISRMLNHSNVTTTARYIHDEEDDALEIADLMEKGLRAESQKATGRRRAPHRAAPPHVGAERRTSA